MTADPRSTPTPQDALPPTRRSSLRVAILGGGWAGMAAAVTLAEGGVKVTVFEAARVLGGRARRVEVNGLGLDNGLHILIGAYRETLRLIAQVSASTGLLREPLDLNILGHFHLRTPPLPAPLHLLIGLLWSEGLTLGERLRAARFMAQLRRLRFRLGGDITVAALLTQFRQSELTRRYLWEPLCISALNTPADTASAQVFLNVLRDSLDGQRKNSELLMPCTDLSALFPEPAARYVEARNGLVLLGNAVSAVRPALDGLTVHGAEGEEHFTHVVCALPPARVADVLGGVPGAEEVTRSIERLVFQPIYSVYLQYPDTLRLPQPMFGLAGGAVQWVFDRERLSGQRGLVGAVISASGQHQQLSQEELALQADRELRVQFPRLPRPLWTQVIAEKRATFSCNVGVDRPPSRTPVRNLFLAGDYTASDYPATLETAVRSGVCCARMILESR